MIVKFDEAPALRFGELVAPAPDGSELRLGALPLPTGDRVPESINATVHSSALYARTATGELASTPSVKAASAHLTFKRIVGADRFDASQRLVVKYRTETVQPPHAVALTGDLAAIGFDGQRYDRFLAPAAV
jgi:hypothetical protein